MNRAFFVAWFKLGCIVAGIAGLVALTASIEAYSGPWLLLLDLVKWPLDGDPAMFSHEALLLNAIIGGVMVGWAALMYFVAAGPIAQGDTKLARQVLISILMWFGIDSIGSYLSQFPGNIAINIFFLIILSIPLFALSKEPKANAKVFKRE